jgi:outer membrane lipase/esterase
MTTAACAVALAISAPAGATTYSTLYVFGDSLSDVGNIYLATGGAIPQPLYYQGQFSNGPNWVDDLAGKLGINLAPSLAGGTDYAYGGATTGSLPIDLPAQIAYFQANVPTPAAGALYTLDIGANDIDDALSDLSSQAARDAAIDQAAAVALAAVGSLFDDGMRSLLYYEVPDLAVVPDFAAYGADATELASRFNAEVLDGLETYEAKGLTVFDLPIFSTIDAIVADPSAYGFTNVTTPCYSGSLTATGPECSTPDKYLFWDGEHPTAAGHAITAELAYDLITGAPTPESSTWAMALIGFAGLGFAGWRAQRRAAV